MSICAEGPLYVDFKDGSALLSIGYTFVWAVSSAGRAPRSQRGSRGFESPTVHHIYPVRKSGKKICENFSEPGLDGKIKLLGF
jgi:hypothetical protein